MVHFFHEHSISAEMIHGKMDKKIVADSIDRFRSGSLSVIISTTIIEVGINVPNATVIMITGAERFGFSTLHQLRGRVGRGKYASYCILQSNKECDRLKFLSEETSGFEIAKKDLSMRGPGSLFGTKQSGNDYFIKLMLNYPNMYERAKKEAKTLCQDATGEDMLRRFEELFVSNEQ